MAKTIATMFAGGEGVSVGARAAGLRHIWGLEVDDKIAAVARLNGFNTLTANVLDVVPSTLERPDVLHASPECQRASVANTSAELNEEGLKETAFDIECGEAVARFIRVLRPEFFTLENVRGYRKFKAFRIICQALRECGYRFNYWNLNSANFGVSQTRVRLILLAGKEMPKKPRPTHTKKPLAFGETLLPWVGWYEAIKNLIPTLPDSHFANWQLARLPQEYKTFLSDSLNYSSARPNRYFNEPAPTIIQHSDKHPAPKALIVDSAGFDDGEGRVPVTREADSPANVITANYTRRDLKAVIVGQQYGSSNDKDERKLNLRSESEPVFAIEAQSNRLNTVAFLLDSQNGHGEEKASVTRNVTDAPAPTISKHSRGGSLRAFLVDGKPANYEGDLQVINADETVPVVTASQDKHPFRAFLIPNENSSSAVLREGDEPSNTVGATERVGNVARAYLPETIREQTGGESAYIDAQTGELLRVHGRVVKMTPRALAVFQSIPRDYILPEDKDTAMKVIGNACPPLMMEKIYRELLT